MATIITKNSQTANAVPSAASLQVGELAVNTADGKLYTEHTGGVVKEIIPSTVVNGGITPAKLSTGAPTWDTNGSVVITGSYPNLNCTATAGTRYTGYLFQNGSNIRYRQYYDNTLGTLENYLDLSTDSYKINDAAGDRLILDGTSSKNLRFNSGYGSAATAYGCRSWVNFNGNGTLSIRASGNVSSVTDNGAGDYTVNFSTSMPDANYATLGSNGDISLNHTNWITGVGDAQSAGAVRIRIVNGGTASLQDRAYVFVAVFR
jgi:hypothetical protein